MNCSDVRDQLESYIADDVTDVESMRIAEHLGRCEPCAAAYERTRSVVADLKGISDAFVPRDRFAPRPAYASGPAGGWVWRTIAVAASAVAIAAVGALSVPAIARELPFGVAKEFDALEDRAEDLQQKVDELTVRLETIDGEQVAMVDTTPGDLAPEEAAAVQQLAMDFIRAQYAGDVAALEAMGTDRLKADLAARPGDYVRDGAEGLTFAQMTEPARAEDGTYLIFVRLMDSGDWSESQYQEDFEIKLIDGRYLVDFMGMDA